MNNLIFLKGILMGIADTIPGISSGTVALITGIYPRFINSLKNFSLLKIKQAFTLLKQKKSTPLKEFLINNDFIFLIKLITGMLLALSLASLIIPSLITYYTSQMFCLFLGFIVPSFYLSWQKIKINSKKCYFYLLLGIITCIFINNLFKENSLNISSTNTLISSIYFLLAGFVAICAMLLPGISGSYILLVLGLYFDIINTVKSFILSFINLFYYQNLNEDHLPMITSFILICSFSLGCLLGIMSFSRFINYLLKKFNTAALNFFTGIVGGSLYVLWPFKDEKIHNPKNFIFATNSFPSIDTNLGISISLFLIAFSLSLFLIKKNTPLKKLKNY